MVASRSLIRKAGYRVELTMPVGGAEHNFTRHCEASGAYVTSDGALVLNRTIDGKESGPWNIFARGVWRSAKFGIWIIDDA